MGVTYAAEQTMTVTNLHSLASSATAGWQSDGIDNTSTGYLDLHFQIVLDFANTAPANDKGVYVFVGSALDATYSNLVTGSEGTITLPTIVSNPAGLYLAYLLPYRTADEVAESPVFGVAHLFGGFLPPKLAVVLMNYTGAALAASGNTVKYRGVSVT